MYNIPSYRMWEKGARSTEKARHVLFLLFYVKMGQSARPVRPAFPPMEFYTEAPFLNGCIQNSKLHQTDPLMLVLVVVDSARCGSRIMIRKVRGCSNQTRSFLNLSEPPHFEVNSRQSALIFFVHCSSLCKN